MSEVMTAPGSAVPVERKCKFEEVFDASFIELILLVPKNPHVRALILQLAGKMPGQECETFEQLKEWVERHCEKRARPVSYPTRRRNPAGGILINVEFSETEFGRASYSVRRSGSDEFRLGAEDLMAIVQSAIEDGEGIDEIVEAVAEKIDMDAWGECDPSLEDSGDYDYNDHEANGSEDSDTEFSRNDIRNAVLAFVRERHPELAAEL